MKNAWEECATEVGVKGVVRGKKIGGEAEGGEGQNANAGSGRSGGGGCRARDTQLRQRTRGEQAAWGHCASVFDDTHSALVAGFPRGWGGMRSHLPPFPMTNPPLRGFILRDGCGAYSHIERVSALPALTIFTIVHGRSWKAFRDKDEGKGPLKGNTSTTYLIWTIDVS